MGQPTRANEEAGRSIMVWGLVGYMALYIIRPWEYKPELQVLRMERLWMVGLLLLLMVYPHRKFKPNIQHVAIGLFSLSQLLSVGVAYSPIVAWDNFVEYLKVVVFYFVLVQAVNSRKDLKDIVLWFLIIGFIYQGKSLWEYVFHGANRYDMGIRRLVGMDTTFGGPNAFAATIVYSLPFASAFLREEHAPARTQMFVWAYFLLSIVCIVLTGSRSGQVAFFVFLLLSLFQQRAKLRLSVYSSILVLAALAVMPEAIRLRLYSTWDESYDFSINKSATVSAEGRIAGLRDGYRLFGERPLLGWGGGNFAHVRGESGEYAGLQAHNMYGQLMAELGLGGILSFSLLVVSIFWNKREVMWQYRSNGLRRGLFFYLAVACGDATWLLLFQGNFAHNLYRYTWLWVAAFGVLVKHVTERDAGVSEVVGRIEGS